MHALFAAFALAAAVAASAWHYTQLKYAARHPHKVRALFADDVFVEGWGTFSERLMLDQGWGGPLARLAHLKKQLENIARAIVDIRVHTQGMTRDEVVRFVKDEALQGVSSPSTCGTGASIHRCS
jgi:uncharacterized protein (DUF885 family)